MSTEVASLFAKITADTSGFERSMDNARDSMTAMERGMNGLQSFMTGALKTGILATGAAVTAFGAGMYKAVDSAADLEQQVANITAVFGGMAPPVKEVGELINGLALNPDLQVGVTDAGMAIEELAKAGATWSDIAGGVAEKTVLLANATGSDLNTSVNIVTDSMAMFGLGVESVNDVVAGAVGVMNQSKLGADDYAMALANLGPTASALGMPLEDMNTLLALTASGFTSGQTQGTSLSWVLKNLTPPTDKAAEAMKELGLITETGANVFYTLDGQLKDNTAVIATLQDAFGGLTAQQQVSYARTIFGSDAWQGLSAILKISMGDIDGVSGSMTDMDAVMDGARIRTETFRGAMAVVGDTINSVFTMVGEKFIPVFTQLARDFAAFAKSNAPDVIAVFDKLATQLQVVVDWLAETIKTSTVFNDKFKELPQPIQNVMLAIDNTIMSIRNFIMAARDILRPVTDLIAQHVNWTDVIAGTALALTYLLWPAITTAIAALGTFVTAIAAVAAPILAAIAVVAALRAAWQSNFGDIQGKTAEVTGYITATFGDLYGTIQTFGKEALREIVAWATGNETTFENARKIWEATQSSFNTAFRDITARLTEFGAVAWAEFQERFPNAAATLQESFAAISGKFTEMWSAVRPLVIQLGEIIQDLAARWQASGITMGDAFKAAQTVIDAVLKILITSVTWSIGTIIDTIKLVAQLLTGDFSGAWQTAKGIVNNTLEALKTVFKTVFDTILSVLGISIEDVSNWRDKVAELFQRAGENILGIMAGVKAAVIEPVKAFIMDTIERIVAWRTWLVERWQEIKDAAQEKWDAIKAAVVDPVQEFVQGTMERIRDWKEWLVTKFGEIWNSVKSALDPAKWLSWGRDLIEGLWNGLKEKWSGLTSWFSGAWNDLVDRFKNFFGIHSPSTLFAQFGADIMAGLSSGVASAAQAPLDAIQSFATQASGIMSSVIEGVKYGANAVNLATADAIAQSRAAEKAAREAWEAAQTAARQAATTPTVPTMPTVPTVPTVPTTPPPPRGGGQSAYALNFSQRDLSAGLSELVGQPGSIISDYQDEDISETMALLRKFGNHALSNLKLYGEVQGSSQAYMAYQSLTGAALPNNSVDRVLDSIQILIKELQSRGVAQQFLIQTPPNASEEDRFELAQLVAYLNGLYGAPA